MAEPTLHNSIREKMLKDEVAYTLSVKLVRSIELPMMAKTAGFDGILIDMEHSSFDLDTTGTPLRDGSNAAFADETA
jgi:2-keto-3-deoxy-L-rhamnonate aldolase RhmA